ncbi:hypothetical protein EYR40_009362 [Pleurotus pulmonarius]|nr:hypothetical protein EYR36_005257 [Pleurotus pulmonarius]KAF4590245.1 hypothetical protein EYR38_009543 [Pleurotus pulmonarius]KAF4590765.1 hypothetical protein EYR40_009362 [Pleurotus pulmonarius]
MGNTNSNVKPRNPSPEGPQQQPHKSLRQKKRSLELPDLAQLGFTNVAPLRQPQSNPINIPSTNAGNGADIDAAAGRRPLPEDFSAGDVTVYPMPANHRQSNYYRSARNDTRDFMPPPNQQRGRTGGAHYHPSIPSVLNLPTHQPQPFVQETVYSTIPMALGKADGLGEILQDTPLEPEADPIHEPVNVKITWTGGGKNVLLARAGDDDWKGRQEMDPDPNNNTIFTANVSLLPGTHHIRFLVDETWRVADDIPTAVDDQGTLANYVAVPIPVPGITSAPPAVRVSPPTVHPHKMQAGPSFWSDDSSSSYPSQYNHPTIPHPVISQDTPHNKHAPPAWTSVIPPELIEAAREEETYLAASAAPHQTGFIAAPNIPPAPGLPRHLDRLILNGKSPGVGIVNGGRSGRATPSGSNSGKRDGKERDRERDREGRDRDRDARGRDGREKSTRRKERERERDRGRDVIQSIPPFAGGSDPANSARTFNSAGALMDLATANRNTPNSGLQPDGPAHIPLPASPSIPVDSPKVKPSTVTTISSQSHNKTPTASGAPTPSPLSLPPSAANISQPLPSSSTALPLHLDPFSDGPGLADDASVLPVPSHVVLQHLSTSAIRNGVLAVGCTTRYRKKFLTIVYYKPT